VTGIGRRRSDGAPSMVEAAGMVQPEEPGGSVVRRSPISLRDHAPLHRPATRSQQEAQCSETRLGRHARGGHGQQVESPRWDGF
jgi:hypothetical protein